MLITPSPSPLARTPSRVANLAPGEPRDEVSLGNHTVAAPRALGPVRHPGHPSPPPALRGSLRVNGMENNSAPPGQPALLEFGFFDPQSGQPVTSFESEHEKPMHALVVSADLDTFAHVHPELSCDGSFRLGINQPTADPDNQAARRAVPKAGNYMIFTEVKPEGKPAVVNRFGLQATGESEPVALIPDAAQPDGTILKYFKADGTPGGVGDPYRALLSVDKMDHGSHKMLDLNVNLQLAHEEQPGQVHYADLTDAQNWLGMAGHGVLISAAGQTPEEKVFRHLHAGSHGDHGKPGPAVGPASNPSVLSMDEPPHQQPPTGAGPDFAFQLMGDQVPPSGVYKLWTQVKREGQILTLPFVFELP